VTIVPPTSRLLALQLFRERLESASRFNQAGAIEKAAQAVVPVTRSTSRGLEPASGPRDAVTMT
jgi:hypothetical protein